MTRTAAQIWEDDYAAAHGGTPWPGTPWHCRLCGKPVDHPQRFTSRTRGVSKVIATAPICPTDCKRSRNA